MKLASEIVGVKLSTVKYIVKAYRMNKDEFMGKLKPKKAKCIKEKKQSKTENKTNFILDSPQNN